MTLANPSEAAQRGFPPGLDAGRVLSLQQGGDRGSVPDEAREPVGAPLVAVEPEQGLGQDQAQAKGLEGPAVGDGEPDPCAGSSPIGAYRRGEASGAKGDALKSGAPQGLDQASALNPGSSDHFERHLGSPSDREVGGFEQPDGGIEQSLVRAMEVGRRPIPLQPRVVPLVLATPAFEPHDFELNVDGVLDLEELGQLAGGHAMDDGEARVVDERVGFAVEGRARHQLAAQGIGTVEDHEANILFGGDLHGGLTIVDT